MNKTWTKVHTLKNLDLEIYQFLPENQKRKNYFLSPDELKESLFRIRSNDLSLFLDELIYYLLFNPELVLKNVYYQNILNFIKNNKLIELVY